jgi:hypothetical protein
MSFGLSAVEGGLAVKRAQAFTRDGVLFPIRVLPDDALRTYLSAFLALERSLGDPFKRMARAHLFFPWAYDLATHPAVVAAVSEILGPEILVWGTLILSKPPHSSAYVSWHQDGAYAQFLGGTPALTAWIALTDSTAENGCLRVVPGSQHSLLPHQERITRDNLLNRGQTVDAAGMEEGAVNVVLKAGEMSLHEIRLVHGSNPNRSPHRRIGFVIRFATPAMKAPPIPVLRACGTGDWGHLKVRNRPVEASDEERIAAYTAYVRSVEDPLVAED